MSLLRALGWLDTPGLTVEAPREATLSELLAAHTLPFIQAVQTAQDIARGDAARRPTCGSTASAPRTTRSSRASTTRSALLAGASLQAMQAILDGRAVHAYSPAGGMHHAMRSRASRLLHLQRHRGGHRGGGGRGQARGLRRPRRSPRRRRAGHLLRRSAGAHRLHPRVGPLPLPGHRRSRRDGRRRGQGRLPQHPPAARRRRRAHPHGLRQAHRPGGARLPARHPRHPDRLRHPSRRPPHRPGRVHGSLSRRWPTGSTISPTRSAAAAGSSWAAAATTRPTSLPGPGPPSSARCWARRPRASRCLPRGSRRHGRKAGVLRPTSSTTPSSPLAPSPDGAFLGSLNEIEAGALAILRGRFAARCIARIKAAATILH